jgi:glycosyltransferase A (GT-A) superfamily protein (DUF2064 family)
MSSWNRSVVAIFVKTPGHSPIKTRLAEDLGPDRAGSLYLDCLDCVREAVDASGLPRVWAVAEGEAIGHALWDDAPSVLQPDGNLGDRMAGIFLELRTRAPGVLLIGGDLPQLDPIAIRKAADWLDAPDRHVIGPAADGGFWLYGSTADNPTARWPSLVYSRSDTARRFRDAIGGPVEAWQDLESATDLDQVDDLAVVRAELAALIAPTPAQRRFLDRLDGIIGQ